MENKIEVSFITVNYNGFNDTCQLVESIQSTIIQVNYEIIVVDNASLNNEALLLQEKYPTVIVIRSERNLGFAGGNNLGIKRASGEYLFFINNDTYIVSDGIKALIFFLGSSPKIGGISPKIKYADPPNNIQFAGFTQLSSITLRNKTIGMGEADREIFNIPGPTPYLHGAAMIIKKNVIEKVGLIPEIYFLYYEELDWSTQIIDNGYELWYYPFWTIYHKESQSTGKQSKLQVFYLTRSRLLYAWRNLKGINKYLSILYQITIVFFKECFNFVLKKKCSHILIVVKGIIAFFSLKNKR